ncbi:hypothetical protein PTTG_27880 [Puccinia triticina 1-1 BBBD Race 1]|uniref:Uncharacterized protein n=1 Tax=Puccinia triticina (isolate 1-1 / race 1 (BBBD)) TaxID=630390 RepID=A0A180GHI7_PUCT1|nr:hypothetical protein PTTG_27880 [Puccinia triticina 1-1 BBBD Race 1]
MNAGPTLASNKLRPVDNPGSKLLRARISDNAKDKAKESKTDQTVPSQREAETNDIVSSLLSRFAEYNQVGHKDQRLGKSKRI